MKNFALTGAAGFIAPRHLKAIRDTGNKLVAAVDPHDSVGILDSYFPDTEFFTSYERFERFVFRQRHESQEKHIHYVSVCSPNYLHDAHIRSALLAGANAICEKPLVINPWNLDELILLEKETGKRVYTILQLRLHDSLIALKEKLNQQKASGHRPNVVLSYITRRGKWYGYSWKGDVKKSGGVAMNIGIHFFDLLMWLFGSVQETAVYLAEPDRMAGMIELEHACVQWYLSINGNDLPAGYLQNSKYAFRSITIDGEEVEFSEGFTDLHTRVYQDILEGRGFGIENARPSIELVHRVRTSEVTPAPPSAHPLLVRKP
jgi:UDP-N-acetyl-2-amino-2-deoxyglucuronate dehydrogenase